jgi:hypothetical protein
LPCRNKSPTEISSPEQRLADKAGDKVSRSAKFEEQCVYRVEHILAKVTNIAAGFLKFPRVNQHSKMIIIRSRKVPAGESYIFSTVLQYVVLVALPQFY